MTKGKWFLLYFFLIAVLALAGCSGQLPATLGQFAPCPDSPNCVSTQATDDDHAIDPFPYSATKANAKKHLLEIIHSLPRARVVTDQQDYLHVEFTSRVWRFIDDVEFYLGVTDRAIHFRSASRVGRSDLGVNRKRMEAIRKRFISAAPKANPEP
ncbi:hypothetical protein MNBD_NITROSPINAE05-681 [hydrothermal vent metagenome]|uniref:DUF1499 domain-containing protein n=1 Tax=hydrothermal vent metagenome TaxID=652676 RepID=A0A3B1DJE7_9ZZZZ